MLRFKYPFQNTSLNNIKGERWKDIPGLEGYYILSNMGRVMRSEYKRIYKNGALYIFPDKLIKPQIGYSKNNFKNDRNLFITIRVVLNGNRYNFMITRLIYYLFVRKYDMDDARKIILCKDTNNLNVQPKNLKLATLSERSIRTVQRGRMESSFKNLTKHFKKKQREAIVKKLQKQVTQYSLTGKKIKTYSSMSAAEKLTGVHATSIGMVAGGGGISAGGYLWQWGDAKTIDINSIRKQRRTSHRKKYGQKLTQYDLTGKRIECFPSIQDAEEATGVNSNAIRLILKGVYKSGKGYYFRKGYGPKSIDLSTHQSGKASMALTQSKKVKQFSLNGKLLRIHTSIKNAALSVNLSTSSICGCCKGRQKSSGGFAWKYA